MASVELESRKLSQDATLELITVSLGGQTWRFTNGTQDPLVSVVHDGEPFFARRFKIGRFKVSSVGQLPRVDLEFDNVDRYWYPILEDNNDLIGADVTHKQVYRQHLDDGDSPDSSEIITQVDSVILARRTLNRESVSFRLAAPLDLEQSLLGRVMVRNVCSRSYRVPLIASDSFNDINTVGTTVNCPYVGGAYYRKDGTIPDNHSGDDCGLKKSDCELRFGNEALPYKGFPSLGDPRA